MKEKLLLFTVLIAVSIKMYAQPIVNIASSTNNVCHGECKGSATGIAMGGSFPYTYNWSNGSTKSIASDLCAGTYTFTVHDSNGDSASATATITQPAQLRVSTISNTSICLGDSINICATGFGGMGVYSYSYNPAVTDCSKIGISSTTTYTVTVTDSYNCTADTTTTITVGVVLPQLTFNYLNFPSCSQSNGTVQAQTVAGTTPYAYQWSNGQQTTIGTSLAAGAYSCTVTDANNCKNSQSFFLPDSCDLVWPGDANDDLIANNLDILAIGIGNDTTGTLRINPSINWSGQPSQNWAQSLSGGSNYKHIDCDGNGIIELNDTLAVIQHFTLTRPASKQAESQHTSGTPDLLLKPLSDTIAPGAPSKLDILLGDVNNQLTNAYGIAFTIQYNTSVIDTASMNLSGNASWMGVQNNNLIAIGLKAIGINELQVAITRTDHSNISGYGKIGEITYKALASISSGQQTIFTISGVKLIDYSENAVPVNSNNTSIFIDPSITGIANQQVDYFKLYPNPAKSQFQIQVSELSFYTIQIYDLFGKKVETQSFFGKDLTMDVSSLKSSIYAIKIVQNNILIGVQKLIIER